MANEQNADLDHDSATGRRYKHHTLKPGEYRVETPHSLNHKSYRKFQEPSIGSSGPQSHELRDRTS